MEDVPFIYLPQNCYWFVTGDLTQVYGSSRNLYVTTNDSGYQAWLAQPPQSNIAVNADTVLNLFGTVSSYLPTAAAILQFGTQLASKATLAELKTIKQAAHDANFDDHFDISAFIRDGTITTITGANIGAFMAQIANNYRTIRAAIANAATPTALNNIDINAGWPANP